MKPGIIACTALVGVLAAGTNAVAQNAGIGVVGARGTGFTVHPEDARAAMPTSLSGLRLDATETWWGLAGTGQHVQVGMSLAPRLGTGVPFPALAYSDRLEQPVELGPGLRWRSAAGTLSASYRIDPTGSTQGDSLRLSFSRPLISDQGFRLLAYVGAEWQSGRTIPTVPGGFGAATMRPLFSAGGAANVGFGLDTHYQLTRSSAIVVGASGLRFGGAPVEGALYADRWQATLYGGYSFRF
ncbi:MAG: MipA/OmpV family protein [Betaproteobacteria bacterium]|nr:MipA/OmpV family protein [Betaproteobacteria bacterium]